MKTVCRSGCTLSDGPRMNTPVKISVGVLVFLILGYILLSPLQIGHVPYQLNEIQLRNAATEKGTKNTDNDILRNDAPKFKPATRNADNETLRFNRYVAVNNPTLIGEEFSFDATTTTMLQNVLSYQTFNRKSLTIDPNVTFFEIVVPTTAASSNHYGEFKENIRHFAKHFPGAKVIFYDIGLNDPQARDIKALPFVSYRKFNFDAYPPHIRNLHNYAWKLLIIQEVLAEFDGAMWFDTSVKFQGNAGFILERMARFKTGILFYVGPTSHSMLAATNPGMLKYFPLKKTDAFNYMLQASAMIILNTADVQKHIMKWACVCAFKPECTSPPDSRIHCGPAVFQRYKYAGCHRFDQALISILATNLYNNQQERYSLNQPNGFAVMSRMG